jgi:hypothetical protein
MKKRKMKFFFLLLVLPFFLRSQSLKPGTYIKTSVRFADGSEVPIKNFLKYRFLTDGTAQLGVVPLFYSLQTTYSVAGWGLTIGRINYKIDKLTDDSLIIHEDGLSIRSDKFRKYYFIHESATPYQQKPIYNDELKDSVYLATNYLFPQLNGKYEDLYPLIEKLASGNQKGFLKISFTITKSGKLMGFKIVENKNIIESLVNETNIFFTSKLGDWIPAELHNKPINANVEMMIRFRTDNSYGTLSSGVVAVFIEQNL